jgi:hypothetical protein
MKSQAISMPSDRSFGWTFAVVFALVSIFHPWVLAITATLVLITLTRAQWLAPLKRAWMKLGALMHHIVSPVIMGAIFFGVFTPVGVVMRAFGRDAMKRRYQPQLASYWERRDPPGPADDSFRDMF